MVRPMYSDCDIKVTNINGVDFHVEGPVWIVSGERVHPDKMVEFGKKIEALYKEYSMNLPEPMFFPYTDNEDEE